MSTHYDLIVLGTGSGNTIVNHEFEGWKVAIVEEGVYGGTCLNRGCIPSKMFVVPAEAAHAASTNAHLGITTHFDGADWPAIRDRVFARIDPIAPKGLAYRQGQPNVDAITGHAVFTGPRTLQVHGPDGTVSEITADQVVIAAGGRPVVPDIPGLDDLADGVVHTSDTVMRLDALPARLAVLGGGYVGSELANVFASLGSDVVQLDRGQRLLHSHDVEVADRFTALVSKRWDLRFTSLDRVEPLPDGGDSGDSGGARLHLGDGTTVDVDVLLLAVGRRPNADLLQLDGTGIEVQDGLVVVDEHQRTTVDGVWALGDISSEDALKHAANQDARVVQHNLLHPDDLVVSDHRFVPNAVFADPEVAALGLTEEQAREQGIDLAVARHEFASVAYGWALDDDDAGHFVKLLADRATGLLVGAHVIGPHAALLVQPLIQAMHFEQPVRGLARGQYWIHPALTEVVENALIDLEKEL